MPTHQVQFFGDASVLANRVATYFAEGLVNGGVALAIAHADHHGPIERALRTRGFDTDGLRARDALLLIDAEACLAGFMRGNETDVARFRATIGATVLAAIQRADGRPVRIYGEMVDVLWAQGRRDAVLALEALWNELLTGHACSLMCGYRFSAFDRDTAAFDAVCNRHAHVTVDEGMQDAPSERDIAKLAQRNRALESEIERRTRVEHRMFELLAVTGDLAATRTREEAARLTIHRGMSAVGAVMAGLWVYDSTGTQLDLLASSEPEERAAAIRRLALASPTPIAHAMRTGEAVFLGSRAEYKARFPVAFDDYGAHRLDSHVAFAVLPLIGDRGVLAVACFAYDHERKFDAPDRAFKSILVRQCAIALERMERHDEERALRETAQQARHESELLYEVTARANELDDVDAVYRLALDAVKRGSNSERAAILLYDADDKMHFKAWHGLSETYRAAVDGHSPWTRDDLHPQAISVDDTETDPAWEPYREVFRAEGIRALAFVPLMHHRQLIGKFMLYRNEPRPFSAHELQLTSAVAIQVAAALERKQHQHALARSYEEERKAHLEAEQATRAREEILSVVSHDLRNPLGTILMAATGLLTIDTGDRGHRIRSLGERIHRQAALMARLIEDLVDFAGIQAGRLAMEPATHAPSDIITIAGDMFTSLVDERGVTLDVRVNPQLPAIRCDSDRVVQVLSNLLANALKVTPRGGTISVGVDAPNDEVVFFVKDTGPGIDATELPNLFERYWRSPSAAYKGAGLGLSIARGIVDAHGGRIWAESQLGSGSTFYFSLASRGN
jgi:signal transduction histidine kinase